MFEIRIHGRGGQGVVTAAEMMSVAAFLDGRHAQAFPSFGSERMGAPVVAFCRIDDRPIRAHDPVVGADAIVVQDPTLLHALDILGALNTDGYVLVNSTRSPDELGLDRLTGTVRADRIVTIPATEMAQRLIGRPVPNTALLGAFAELTGVVPLEAVIAAVQRRFDGPLRGLNAAAAAEAAAYVRSERRKLARA